MIDIIFDLSIIAFCGSTVWFMCSVAKVIEDIRKSIASLKDEQRDIRELYYQQSEKIRELKDKINKEKKDE